MSGMDRLMELLSRASECFKHHGVAGGLADDIDDALTDHRRASQAAPAPVAYRLRFAGEGAGDWGIVAPENAAYYIGRDGYECQPLYAAPAPSDGLREAVGNFLLEKGGVFRCGEGAELNDAYEAAVNLWELRK